MMWDYSLNMENQRWSVWYPIRAAGATYYPPIGGAVICQPDGLVLLEDQDLKTDGGQHYEFAVRTGDARPGMLLQGENNFLRLAVSGEYKGPHTAGVWTFSDNAPNWDDCFTFNPANQIAVYGWGDASLPGSGQWDDDPSAWIQDDIPSPDGVYRFKRHLPRHRSSTLSVRISDMGAPNDTFLLSEIAFDIAEDNGLTRTPARIFSGPEVG